MERAGGRATRLLHRAQLQRAVGVAAPHQCCMPMHPLCVSNTLCVGQTEAYGVVHIVAVQRYFWRGKFYGEPDDGARFSFFSRAALEFLAQRQHEAPDIIHCHDWQAAAVVSSGPVYAAPVMASLCGAQGEPGVAEEGTAQSCARQRTYTDQQHFMLMQGPLLKETYRASGLARTRAVLTIHNMAFQVGGWEEDPFFGVVLEISLSSPHDQPILLLSRAR